MTEAKAINPTERLLEIEDALKRIKSQEYLIAGGGFGSRGYERELFYTESRLNSEHDYLINGGEFPLPNVTPQQRIEQIKALLMGPAMVVSLEEGDTTKMDRLFQELAYLEKGKTYPLDSSHLNHDWMNFEWNGRKFALDFKRAADEPKVPKGNQSILKRGIGFVVSFIPR